MLPGRHLKLLSVDLLDSAARNPRDPESEFSGLARVCRGRLPAVMLSAERVMRPLASPQSPGNMGLMTSSPLNAQPSRDPIAQVRDLVKTFGDGDSEVRAVDGVSIDLFRGEFTAIMGPSGSGKSTFMHCLAGLDPATSGTMLVNRQSLMHMSDKELTRFRRQNIGFIFQAFNLLPTLTAEQNIRLPMELARQKIDENYFDVVVDTVGLRPRLDHRPAEMSGGQQQRVACARALVAKPSIIFADEPTGNLDSVASDDVLTFLRRSVDDFGQTIVMVTHEPSAAAYADRVLFLADGKFFAELREPDADTVLEYMGRTRRATADAAGENQAATVAPPAAGTMLAPPADDASASRQVSSSHSPAGSVLQAGAGAGSVLASTPVEPQSNTATPGDVATPGVRPVQQVSGAPAVNPKNDAQLAPPVGPAIGFAGPPQVSGQAAADSPTELVLDDANQGGHSAPNAHMNPQSMALPTFNSELSNTSPAGSAESSASSASAVSDNRDMSASAASVSPVLPAPAPIVVPNTSARGSVQRPSQPAAKPAEPASKPSAAAAAAQPSAAPNSRSASSADNNLHGANFTPRAANIAAAAAAGMKPTATPRADGPRVAGGHSPVGGASNTAGSKKSRHEGIKDLGRNAAAESAHARQPATHPALWTAQANDSGTDSGMSVDQARGSSRRPHQPPRNAASNRELHQTSRPIETSSRVHSSAGSRTSRDVQTERDIQLNRDVQPSRDSMSHRSRQSAQGERFESRYEASRTREPSDYFGEQVSDTASDSTGFPWDEDNRRAYGHTDTTRESYGASSSPNYGAPWTEPQPAITPDPTPRSGHRSRYTEAAATPGQPAQPSQPAQPVRPEPAPEIRSSGLLDDPLAAAARRPLHSSASDYGTPGNPISPAQPVRPKPPAARTNPTQAQAQIRAGQTYADQAPMLSIHDLPPEPEYYDDEVDVA